MRVATPDQQPTHAAATRARRPARAQLPRLRRHPSPAGPQPDPATPPEYVRARVVGLEGLPRRRGHQYQRGQRDRRVGEPDDRWPDGDREGDADAAVRPASRIIARLEPANRCAGRAEHQRQDEVAHQRGAAPRPLEQASQGTSSAFLRRQRPACGRKPFVELLVLAEPRRPASDHLRRRLRAGRTAGLGLGRAAVAEGTRLTRSSSGTPRRPGGSLQQLLGRRPARPASSISRNPRRFEERISNISTDRHPHARLGGLEYGDGAARPRSVGRAARFDRDSSDLREASSGASQRTPPPTRTTPSARSRRTPRRARSSSRPSPSRAGSLRTRTPRRAGAWAGHIGHPARPGA